MRRTCALLLLALPLAARAQVVIPDVAGAPVVNPVTNRIYAGTSTELTEVDGATHAIRRVAGASLQDRLVDPIQNRIWVGSGAAVKVFEGDDLSMQALPMGSTVRAMALDPGANLAWAMLANGSLVRIDGSDLGTDTLSLDASFGSGREGAIAVDPAGGRAFVAFGDRVVEIDADTLATRTVLAPTSSRLAFDPHLGRLFTTAFVWEPAQEATSYRLVRIDASAMTVLGQAHIVYDPEIVGPLAADPVQGRVWLDIETLCSGVGVRGHDAVTGAFVAGMLNVVNGCGEGWTLNPATNRVYAVGGLASPGGRGILDADVPSSSFAYLGHAPDGIAVNVATNRTYHGAIDEETFTGPRWLVETPEAETVPVPITTTITHDPPAGGSVTVHFDAVSTFAPIAPAIQQIYYQVDAIDGAWSKATPAGDSGSATLALSPGTHTIHAFAVDGQEATIGNIQRTSPIVGAMASIEVVMPAAAACSNGIDDDGDTLVDFPDDAGCKSAASALENPQCNNGDDDDGDLAIDHPADARCRAAWDNDEATNPACGFGAELVLLLAIVERRLRSARA